MMPLSDATGKPGAFCVLATTWQAHGNELAAIRRTVFIEEQQVPEALEWDGEDASAMHFLAHDTEGMPIGCARLLPGGKLGRMAVLQSWRRRGVGMALLQAAIAACQARGDATVRLAAQVQAITFYQKAGFRVCSDIYDDAGIPHRDMMLTP